MERGAAATHGERRAVVGGALACGTVRAGRRIAYLAPSPKIVWGRTRADAGQPVLGLDADAVNAAEYARGAAGRLVRGALAALGSPTAAWSPNPVYSRER